MSEKLHKNVNHEHGYLESEYTQMMELSHWQRTLRDKSWPSRSARSSNDIIEITKIPRKRKNPRTQWCHYEGNRCTAFISMFGTRQWAAYRRARLLKKSEELPSWCIKRVLKVGGRGKNNDHDDHCRANEERIRSNALRSWLLHRGCNIPCLSLHILKGSS